MKWLSKVFKSGSDRGVTDRQHPQFNGEENMVWRAPARSLDDRSRTGKEREELDRAIALSLAEDLKRPPGYRWQTENNEDLRALQDSLNSPYPPYAPTDYYPRGYRLLTGAILAHELMHGWLRLKGYRNLNPEVEEGICQVLSYMWLESEVMPGSKSMPSTSAASSSSLVSSKKGGKSGVENKLGEFFMHQIAHDASPAYGGGFRAANAAVNKYGLRRTLDHIRLTGSFPL
ncbi:DA1-related protein 2 [Actinidia rufa]|uniref:DA1-related protein 2 n=1 Tax=Actinidia rufa TaxID=165716 RepID=A0A7J0GW73_9ERIC|nr:DA1-related protein 2 [Actinidia rufa]